jgi:hypothetical protein
LRAAKDNVIWQGECVEHLGNRGAAVTSSTTVGRNNGRIFRCHQPGAGCGSGMLTKY